MQRERRADDPFGPGARREHDEKIYLSEDRYDQPKEYFKWIAEVLDGESPGFELLDVGCATGEFLYYLAGIRPDGRYVGVDVVQKLLDTARTRVATASFDRVSILDDDYFRERKFDVVTCLGVLSMFDSLEQPLGNLVSILREGGLLVVLANVNEQPLDLVCRHRRADIPEQSWQLGANVFSKHTYEQTLGAAGHDLEIRWKRFLMPFAIEPHDDDPYRAWTIPTAADPHHQVRGTGQLVNLHFLFARLRRLAASG